MINTHFGETPDPPFRVVFVAQLQEPRLFIPPPFNLLLFTYF